MTLTDILNDIGTKVKTLSREELAQLWNWVFVAEEKISPDDMKGNTKQKEESLKAEISSMLLDEISSLNTKKLISTYNKLFEEHLTVHDLDKEDELEEDM